MREMGSPSGCVVAQYAFDGLGAQVSRRLCALADARATGARYIHRPFPPPGFEHTAGNDSAAAEAAFSLGAGAVVVDSPKALRLCTRLVACSSEHYSVADLLATAHAARKRFRPSSVWRCRKDATVLHVRRGDVGRQWKNRYVPMEAYREELRLHPSRAPVVIFTNGESTASEFEWCRQPQCEVRTEQDASVLEVFWCSVLARRFIGSGQSALSHDIGLCRGNDSHTSLLATLRWSNLRDRPAAWRVVHSGTLWVRHADERCNKAVCHVPPPAVQQAVGTPRGDSLTGFGGESYVDDWLRGARVGHCDTALRGDCATDNKGSFTLSARAASDFRAAAVECGRKCLACSRCRFLSFSSKLRDCSWYYTCDLDALHVPSAHATLRLTRSRPAAEPRPGSESADKVVVVAHFNEWDASEGRRVPDWANDQSADYFMAPLYQRLNASAPLYVPNHAFEAGPYLRYIADNYDRLPRVLVFTQADGCMPRNLIGATIRSVTEQLLRKAGLYIHLNSNIYYTRQFRYLPRRWPGAPDNNRCVRQLFELFNRSRAWVQGSRDTGAFRFNFVSSACFAVHREVVLATPRELWRRAYEQIVEQGACAGQPWPSKTLAIILEHLWHILLANKHPLWEPVILKNALSPSFVDPNANVSL